MGQTIWIFKLFYLFQSRPFHCLPYLGVIQLLYLSGLNMMEGILTKNKWLRFPPKPKEAQLNILGGDLFWILTTRSWSNHSLYNICKCITSKMYKLILGVLESASIMHVDSAGNVNKEYLAQKPVNIDQMHLFR